MDAVPPELVRGLVSALHLRLVVFCLPAGDFRPEPDDPGVPRAFSSAAGVLEGLAAGAVPHGALVVCPGPVDWALEGWDSDRTFRRDVHWLFLGRADAEEVAGKALRLDSNVYLYSAAGEGGGGGVLREVFRVRGGPAVFQRLGTFGAAGAGLAVADTNVWQRRTDLGGVAVRNSVVMWRPITYLGEDEAPTGGLMPEVLASLADTLNFTTTWAIPPDRGYGSLMWA